MKLNVLGSMLAIVAWSAVAADSNPKEDVTSAAQKLGQQGNYSWKSSIEFGNFSGGTEGKIEKEGLIGLSMTFGENKTEAFLKGGKGAVKPQDEDWQSLTENVFGPASTEFQAAC